MSRFLGLGPVCRESLSNPTCRLPSYRRFQQNSTLLNTSKPVQWGSYRHSSRSFYSPRYTYRQRTDNFSSRRSWYQRHKNTQDRRILWTEDSRWNLQRINIFLRRSTGLLRMEFVCSWRCTLSGSGPKCNYLYSSKIRCSDWWSPHWLSSYSWSHTSSRPYWICIPQYTCTRCFFSTPSRTPSEGRTRADKCNLRSPSCSQRHRNILEGRFQAYILLRFGLPWSAAKPFQWTLSR